MGAAAGALAALEIAVRGRGAAFAGAQGIAVERRAERAAGLAPFESGVAEDAVEPFGFGLALHRPRAGHDPGRHARLAALGDRRRLAQIIETRIGAGADEDAVDRDLGEKLAGR